jgi:class 3 adenylate cyclase
MGPSGGKLNGIRDGLRQIDVPVRIGVHAGECERAGGGLRGVAVHVGARIGGAAEADEILVSSTVRDLVAGSGIAFEDAGRHELRGVPESWQLYRVVSTGNPDLRIGDSV